MYEQWYGTLPLQIKTWRFPLRLSYKAKRVGLIFVPVSRVYIRKISCLDFLDHKCYIIKVMQKLFLGFLILVMLTPGLACGPFMGMAKAQAAQPMMDMPDCKGMGMDGPEKSSDERVFFKDCSKTDLFSADQASLQKPDIDGKVFFTILVDAAPVYIFNPADTHSIRGPPPDWPDVSQTQPSILLTTQRFRE